MAIKLTACFTVLTDRDVLHEISAFIKTIPCQSHTICSVNSRCRNNKCKFHKKCKPVPWRKLKNGDSVASAGWLSALIEIPISQFSEKAIKSAAFYGHLDVIKWLHINLSMGFTTKAMDNAAEGGHLEVIKWLHCNRTEGCTMKAIAVAARNGHLDVIKWLHSNRTEGCTASAMDNAAHGGHLDVIKWLHENRTEGCSAKAVAAATENGHLGVIKW
jgi:hypothetical protein